MKFAFVVGQFPVMSETFILNQITGLIDRGHQVDIYTPQRQAASVMQTDVEKYNLLAHTYSPIPMPPNSFVRAVRGLQIISTHFPKDPKTALNLLNVAKYGGRAASLWQFYTAAPLLGCGPYDAIHCHFGPSGFKGALLRELGVLQGKLITTFHGSDVTTYLKEKGDRAYDPLFQVGDLFLPISEHWKQQLLKLGCNKHKTVVHHMGIDCDKFSFAPRFLREGDRIRLITICRLVEKKGVEYGIRAVAKLVNTHPHLRPRLEYNIAGDGPLKASLETLIQELEIGDTVKLLGWQQQQDLIELLDRSHILLAPSVTSSDGNQEGIPVALMEAMSRGLPVISSLHSGIPELIENGKSGFLIPERDVDGLAAKLDHLIHHPEIWSDLGKAGRTQVEQHFNIKTLNDRLVELSR
ncbi:MAG: colanic acid biosynthesis glycosyltransferase WcaL [Leptolyngbyaceae cyanobacterium SM1_4_3]|nr:colanic acid biosynthesis glycosyltransferase WcaL [Leptolyngbyaceae cyanobacterium SM1_4_3]NJN92460.1 colanic acid biosynthesis glycosyltransferase WcaL [Leptolyngbyaceae cyanobacterium SL_5_14]